MSDFAHRLERSKYVDSHLESAVREDLEEMPEEKIARLYKCAVVKHRVCGSCETDTWLIGAAGHNSTDTCHECGKEYKVVG